MGLGWLDVSIGKRIKRCHLFQPELTRFLPDLSLPSLQEENTLGLHCCRLRIYGGRGLVVMTPPMLAQALPTTTDHHLFPSQTPQPIPGDSVASDPLPDQGRAVS